MLDKAWLSILGLFKYDNTVFSQMKIPKASELDLNLPYMQSAVQDLSMETLQFKILMDLAELPLVYTDPELMRYMIGRWSEARLPVWRELWKTTLYKYSPIWNKEGVVEETRDLKTTGNTSGTTSSNTDRTVEHQVTGFDTDAYANDTKDIVDDDSGSSTTGQMAGSENETVRRVEQGNIGVTTTQQMIKEQREIVLLDMYQIITDEFKKQFCVMIY